MFFGYREGEEPDPDDEDLQLIPRLVTKVVVPRIAGNREAALINLCSIRVMYFFSYSCLMWCECVCVYMCVYVCVCTCVCVYMCVCVHVCVCMHVFEYLSCLNHPPPPPPHTHTHTSHHHAGLLQHVWDPLSTSQTQRVVALIRRLAEDYPTVSAENKETQVIEWLGS